MKGQYIAAFCFLVLSSKLLVSLHLYIKMCSHFILNWLPRTETEKGGLGGRISL